MLLQNLLLENNAKCVAELELDGLAVCYFNHPDRDSKQWEVAFLSEVPPRPDDGHVFSICIEKRDQNNTLVGKSHCVPEDKLKQVRRLELKVPNGSNAHYTQFPDGYLFHDVEFEREPFTGHPQFHQYDFRWVIDFAGPELNDQHGGFHKLNIPRAYSATVLKVPHALFYTKAVTTYPMLLIKRGESNLKDAEVFGHTNELVGAFVFAESPGDTRLVGTTLSGEPIFDELLPYQEGHHYRIVFKNMEQKRKNIVSEIVKSEDSKKKPKLGNYKGGDFEVFYEVINVNKNERYNLFGPTPTLTMKGKLGDCNIVRIGPGTGVETLDYLLGQTTYL